MRHQPRILADNIGNPCDCLECQAAGVTHLQVVRVPADETHPRSYWLHGEPLRRWWDARNNVTAQLAALRQKFGLRPKGAK